MKGRARLSGAAKAPRDFRSPGSTLLYEDEHDDDARVRVRDNRTHISARATDAHVSASERERERKHTRARFVPETIRVLRRALQRTHRHGNDAVSRSLAAATALAKALDSDAAVLSLTLSLARDPKAAKPHSVQETRVRYRDPDTRRTAERERERERERKPPNDETRLRIFASVSCSLEPSLEPSLSLEPRTSNVESAHKTLWPTMRERER